MQLAAFGLERLHDQSNMVSRNFGMFRCGNLRQLVDEHLAIAKIAQDVLTLLQFADRVVYRADAGLFSDLREVAKLLERDAGGVSSVGKVHAGGVVDRFAGGDRPLCQAPCKLYPPAPTNARPWVKLAPSVVQEHPQRT